MAINKDLISRVVQEALEQVAQQTGQAIDQQSEKQTSQDISVARENKFEEIGSGEAHRGALFGDKELWSVNKKMLSAIELKEKELQLAEREAKLRKQADLDAIAVSEAQQASIIKHLANTFAVNFAVAAGHPFSPNDGENESSK